MADVFEGKPTPDRSVSQNEDNSADRCMRASSENLETRFRRVVTEFLISRRCPMPMGPPCAMFSTPSHGGGQLVAYPYGILTEGGWTPGGRSRFQDSSRGRGCSTYEELENTFLSLLDQHTKPDLPVVVRVLPEVERAEDGRWRGYFRFVQLDFRADAMLVSWSLEG